MSSQSPYKARRTPQACVACRRRKTKCDGVRPRCRHCASRHRQCVWPDDSDFPPPAAAAPISPVASTATVTTSTSPASIPSALPEWPAVRRCLDLFLQYHWATDFCSFLYRPDFEAHYSDAPFLTVAMISLCARYLTLEEARNLFGCESAHAVWARYTPIARSLAKETSDEPNVSNIQANLVLGQSELLADAGSSHWMHIGTAIRMAQIMRLNREFHQRNSLKEQEIRRRTFWACLLFDRLIAFLMAKPRTLYEVHISVALPISETSLAYGEATNGLTLNTLAVGGFVGRVSDTGLMPFYIKTLTMWSAIADIKVCGGRFFEKAAPTQPASRFYQRHHKLREWVSALPPSLSWSKENYNLHCSVGQGGIFATMHFLLHSAFCVAHQLYLPQANGQAILTDKIDASGWSLLRREPAFINTCISNALVVGEIATTLWEAGAVGVCQLQSVWIANAMLSAAPTFLWLQFATDHEGIQPETRAQAQSHLALFATVMSGWKTWAVAKPWRNTMKVWTAVYRLVYLGEPIAVNLDGSDEDAINQDSGEDSFTDAYLKSQYRPEPGNGLCPLPGDGSHSLREASYLNNTLRLNVIDEAAKRALLHASSPAHLKFFMLALKVTPLQQPLSDTILVNNPVTNSCMYLAGKESTSTALKVDFRGLDSQVAHLRNLSQIFPLEIICLSLPLSLSPLATENMARIHNLISKLPQAGFQWVSYGGNKAFLSNAAARRITLAFRRYLPAHHEHVIAQGLIRMLTLVETELAQCEAHPTAASFFTSIKGDIPWMARLSGKDFAALFRAMLIARQKITDARQTCVDSQIVIPGRLRVSTPLTTSFDRVRVAFRGRYDLRAETEELLANYGFDRAADSADDTRSEDEGKGSEQQASQKDSGGIVIATDQNNQGTTAESLIVSANVVGNTATAMAERTAPIGNVDSTVTAMGGLSLDDLKMED